MAPPSSFSQLFRLNPFSAFRLKVLQNGYGEVEAGYATPLVGNGYLKGYRRVALHSHGLGSLERPGAVCILRDSGEETIVAVGRVSELYLHLGIVSDTAVE